MTSIRPWPITVIGFWVGMAAAAVLWREHVVVAATAPIASVVLHLVCAVLYMAAVVAHDISGAPQFLPTLHGHEYNERNEMHRLFMAGAYTTREWCGMTWTYCKLMPLGFAAVIANALFGIIWRATRHWHTPA